MRRMETPGGEGYVKELGEISPEVSRRVVSAGLVPLPRAGGPVAVGDHAAPKDGPLEGNNNKPEASSEEEQMSVRQPIQGEERKESLVDGSMAVPVDSVKDTAKNPAGMPEAKAFPADGKPSRADPPAALAPGGSASVPSSSAHALMDADVPNEGREASPITTSAKSPAVSPKSAARPLPAEATVQPMQIDPSASSPSSLVEEPSIPAPQPGQKVPIDELATNPETSSVLLGTASADQGTSASTHKETDDPAAVEPSLALPVSDTTQSDPPTAVSGPTAEASIVVPDPVSRDMNAIMEDAAVKPLLAGSESLTKFPQAVAAVEDSLEVELGMDMPLHEDDSASKAAREDTAVPGAGNPAANLVIELVDKAATGDIIMESVDAAHASPKPALPSNLADQGSSVLFENDTATTAQPTTEQPTSVANPTTIEQLTTIKARSEMGSAQTPSSLMQSVADRMHRSDPDTSDLTSLPSHDTLDSSRRTHTDPATSERLQTQAPTVTAADTTQAAHENQAVHSGSSSTQRVLENDGTDRIQPPAASPSKELVHASQGGSASDTSGQNPAGGPSDGAPMESILSTAAERSIAVIPAGPSAAAETAIRPASPNDDPLAPAKVPDSVKDSPSPPPVTRIPRPVDPRMLQRMLEKQILVGRQTIMSHARAKQRELEEKIGELKRQYKKLDKQWESHKTRIIAENEELARQLESVPNPAAVQDPKPGGRKTRRGFVEQDHELMGFRDGDDEALAKALKAIEEMMESDPTQRALKTEAAIPNMELDPDIWRLAYDDENALVADPLAFYGHGVGEAPGEWTDEEERKFRKLYATYPKQFGEIARGLPNKTTAQCVKHYYLTKKKRPFKEGANRNGQRQAAGGQAARMVAPVTREKVELAGVLATGDRAQAKQVADDIRPQGEGRKAGKRKVEEAERSGDQSAKDGQKAKRKTGSKKRMVDIATAGDRAASGDGLAAKKRKTLKKPSRLDLKDRGQSASNRSSVSVADVYRQHS